MVGFNGSIQAISCYCGYYQSSKENDSRKRKGSLVGAQSHKSPFACTGLKLRQVYLSGSGSGGACLGRSLSLALAGIDSCYHHNSSPVKHIGY